MSSAFERASKYLLGTINETVSPRTAYRLERMRALLHELGDPQEAYPTVHVGGTSGKGSTATMLAAVLTQSGKRCGLHTKPHLLSVTERACIDGIPIDPEAFGELLEEMISTIERVAAAYGRATYYETLLALAFLYFARQHVDVAVIEVGLGGKLDGTNVITPRVAVITNVGLDHTEVLGPTVELIAADKAGIAKPGVPLVCGAEEPARGIIAAACRRVSAPFVEVDERARVEVFPSEGHAVRCAVRTGRASYDLRLQLFGRFQARNAATAIVALEALGDDLRPAPGDVESALAGVKLPGRMEYFPAHPPLLFDIAHNPHKAKMLMEALEAEFPGRRTFVVAISEGKDARTILQTLARGQASFIFTTFDMPGRRALSPQRLASIADDCGVWGRAIDDPVEALSVARRNAGADEMVVVTGSTFVVAQLREWWLRDVGKPVFS